MTEKRFILIDGVKKGTHSGIWDNLKQNNQRVGDELWVGEVVAMLNEGIAIVEEKEQLKHQNELLSDELEQCRAVIDNRWSEYLKKKELEE
jgi:hypothetical protein